MKLIGIDPGLRGAISLITVVKGGSQFLLNRACRLPFLESGELDVKDLAETLKQLQLETKIVVVERPVGAAMAFGKNAKGGQNRVSSSGILTSGNNFGRLTATIELATTMRLEFVYPRTWTADLFVGLPKAAKPKQNSLLVFNAACEERSRRWCIPAGCRVPHDGIIDAALIAWWYSQCDQVEKKIR